MSSEKRPQIKTADHVLGFPRFLTSEVDVRAVFRDAVQRLRGIYADRVLGLGQVVLTEQDKKLLAGELEYLVPPGHTFHLTTQPQVVFRPERLVLDDDSADHFSVGDIKVGKNSQFLNASPLPGSLFRSSTSPVMKMDTAQVAMFVTVTLTNTSSDPRPVPEVSLLGKIIGREKA